MGRVLAASILALLWVQEGGGAAAEKARLHEELAAAAEGVGDQLIKSKSWDEARAFLELIRAKSDARSGALDQLIAKTEKQTSGLKWDAKASDLVKAFGTERAKGFFAFAKAWRGRDAEAARWTEAEAEILDDLLDYVKAYARLTQVRTQYDLPKTRFDWKLSVPAVWHARYKLLNPRDTKEVEGKSGFSGEGQLTAENSISSGRESLTELTENILHAPFYRNYALHPNLERIGTGLAIGTSNASVIDVESGLATRAPVPRLTVVPRNNARDVPLTGYDDYAPIFAGKTMRQLGYPISVILFDPTIRPRAVKARLSKDMKDVEFYMSAPDDPTASTRAPTFKSTILLVPKEPLRPETEYSVTVRFIEKGEEHKEEWRFRTSR